MKAQSFESEKELVQAILTCVKRARGREYRVELEVDAGVGIADLILTKRSPRSTKGLHALGNISPRLAVLLSQELATTINNRQSLAASLGASESATQRVIASLSAAGVATQSRNVLKLTAINKLPFERLIAVEAKISDWQRVLVQAYRNLQFADESWVVLDHSFIRPALLQLDQFKVAGVGLASIDSNHNLFIHSGATSHGPMSLGKRWQAQAVLATRVLARRAL